jgi:hypothetical protein
MDLSVRVLITNTTTAIAEGRRDVARLAAARPATSASDQRPRKHPCGTSGARSALPAEFREMT